MSLLDSESGERLTSDLDLFNVPPTQTSIGDCYYVNYYPITSLERNGPIEFVIKTSNDVYLDIANTLLYTKSKIPKNDNSELPKAAAGASEENIVYVAPINYFHATQFKNVEVYINGKLISTSDNMSAYRAYIECLLSYSADAKREQLRSAYFYTDDGNDLDWIDTSVDDEDSTEKYGLHQRFERSKHSTSFETLGRVHSEIFAQNRMIPGGNEIRVKFHRNDAAFSLLSKLNEHQYAISTDVATLMVRHCNIAPHIVESHTRAVQTRNLKYPIQKITMKFFTRSSGRNDLSEPNLVNGILPDWVIVGLVRADAFSGAINKNPLNFKHFNAQTIVLRKNGNPIPFEEIELDYSKDLYQQGYFSLLQASGKMFQDQGFDIKPEQYKNGYALYGFNIKPDLSPCGSFNLLTEGKLSLEIKLKNESSVSITTVVFLQYQSMIEIDKDGNVFTNE